MTWQRRITWAAVILLMSLVAYIPAMRGGYIWDDNNYIERTNTLRDLPGLVKIWTKTGVTPQYYPLTFTSFWIENQLWGMHPAGYHVVNVVLHALGAWLLGLILWRLGLPAPWLAATIFALHPVQVESVAWATERKNVLSGVFYFAAALAWLRFAGIARPESKPLIHPGSPSKRGKERRSPSTGGVHANSQTGGWYAVVFGLFVCALLSKTVTSSLPAAMVLVLWWKKKRLTATDLALLVPMFVVGAVMGLRTSWIEQHLVGASGLEWALSFFDRLLIAGRAVWFYAGKLVWPDPLIFIYPRWQIDPSVWWQWVYPLAALAVVAALWRWRDRLGRGPLVAVLFFGGTLFPALGFINVYPMRYSFVADHFQYLACVGLIVLGSTGAAQLVGWAGRPGRVAGAVCWAGLLGIYGTIVWQQGAVYQDRESLWRSVIARHPASWIAHNNLGQVLYEQNKLDEAGREYEQVLRIKPDHLEATYSLGLVLDRQGRLPEAQAQFERTLALQSNYSAAYNSLGGVLFRQGRLPEASVHYRTAIRIRNGRFLEARLNLANALQQQGDIAGAIENYRAALSLDPTNVFGLRNLAWIRATWIEEKYRDPAEALRLADQAVKLTGAKQPWHLDALAAALARSDRFTEAVQTAERALQLAQTSGQNRLARQIQERLALYQAGQPFTENSSERGQ